MPSTTEASTLGQVWNKKRKSYIVYCCNVLYFLRKVKFLCNDHLECSGIKEEEISEYQHDDTTNCETVSCILAREMEIFERIECNTKYKKIIKHIKECVESDISLLCSKAEWAHFKKLGECLRNADRTSKLDHIDRKSYTNGRQEDSNTHRCFSDFFDLLCEFAFLVDTRYFAFSVFVRKKLIEEESSSSERYKSNNRCDDMIKLHKIPSLVPDIEDHKVHYCLCKDKYPRYLKHLFSRSRLDKYGEEHHEYPHSTWIESIDESKYSCKNWERIFFEVDDTYEWKIHIHSILIYFTTFCCTSLTTFCRREFVFCIFKKRAFFHSGYSFFDHPSSRLRTLISFDNLIPYEKNGSYFTEVIYLSKLIIESCIFRKIDIIISWLDRTTTCKFCVEKFLEWSTVNTVRTGKYRKLKVFLVDTAVWCRSWLSRYLCGLRSLSCQYDVMRYESSDRAQSDQKGSAEFLEIWVHRYKRKAWRV